MQEINVQFVIGLYEKYIEDLRRVREYGKNLLYSENGYSRAEKNLIYRILGRSVAKIKNCFGGKARMYPLLGDIEAEITYLMIRELKPEKVVEISPYEGWSTTWILSAIKDNGFGKLYSYDLTDVSKETVPSDLSDGRWVFIKGDIFKNMDKVPNKIPYLFLDSDHSAEFTRKYIKNIFPRLENGALVSVHDVVERKCYRIFNSESDVILDWLKDKGLSYFTASSVKGKSIHNEIMSVKRRLNIAEPIVYRDPIANGMIFFKKD